MATILSKFSPLPLPIPNDDEDEFSYSFQTDISFADEYTGPSIANVPRANPLEVDEIPTAHPVSSSNLSSGLSYPVVQPLVTVTKKPPEASPSVVLRPHHVVSGSSSSSSPSERLDLEEETNSSVDLSGEVIEDALDDCTSEVNANRVRFVSECDESSYMTDEESVAAAQPRAERKGKRGSCYRCLMGNRFTEKELCIVCDAKYCSNCVRRAMGAMPEGRKCVTCIGHRVSESNRKSLGKCSRMLKRVLTDSELQRAMHDEVTCKANQLYARLISVNGRPLSEEELDRLQTCPNPPKKLKPGDYWYDKLAGYWGKVELLVYLYSSSGFIYLNTQLNQRFSMYLLQVGEKPCQIISHNMNIGGAIMEKASNGDTEIFINSREITKTELMMLKVYLKS